MSTTTLSDLAKLVNQSSLSTQSQRAIEEAITTVAHSFGCSRQQAAQKLYALAYL